MSSATNAYDIVPYPNRANAHTHPDRLAAIAVLYGMVPPDVEHCRVLEIGCGDGNNLIPMAFGLPKSAFVGIDLATKPIEAAEARIKCLGLRNIQAHSMNLLDIEPEFGEFDYIIAHGLYSWVPKGVQDKLLAVCNQNLSHSGVAFVSYNAHPGGHIRQMLREMIQFRTRRIDDPEEQAREGKAFLRLLLEAMDTRTPFRKVFQEEFERMSTRGVGAIYHDELSPNFSPVHFADFVERAARHGLQFLSEVELSGMIDIQPNPEPLAALMGLAAGDLIASQQYFDFVKFRWFRQTLLCHQDVHLLRDRPADYVRQLFLASPLRLSAENPNGATEFSDFRGPGTIKTNNPILISILRELDRIWPRAERFDCLLNQVCARDPDAFQSDLIEDLPKALLTLAAMSLVDLRTHRLPIAEAISDRPEASLLARLESRESDFVTTLLHSHVKLEDEQVLRFLHLLDGTRDRLALADAVAIDHPNVSRDSILEEIDKNLVNIYRLGLLTA